MAKEPLNPKDAFGAKVDELLGAKARGDILKGSWLAQGVERRLDALELMIEGWKGPNVNVAPGVDDIANLEAGTRRCRKLLDNLRVLLEVVPTPTLLASIKAGSPTLESPPSGWLPEKVADHEKKVREKLVEIDEAIRDLNHIEHRITNG